VAGSVAVSCKSAVEACAELAKYVEMAAGGGFGITYMLAYQWPANAAQYACLRRISWPAKSVNGIISQWQKLINGNMAK